jgi:hypothetical protein
MSSWNRALIPVKIELLMTVIVQILIFWVVIPYILQVDTIVLEKCENTIVTPKRPIFLTPFLFFQTVLNSLPPLMGLSDHLSLPPTYISQPVTVHSSAMKTKTAWSSKKLVSAYNTRQCDNPEDTI